MAESFERPLHARPALSGGCRSGSLVADPHGGWINEKASGLGRPGRRELKYEADDQ
jgi:hypothetical protein